MRRLTALIIALAVAWAAASLLVGDGASLGRVRDGGLVALVSALIMGWWALPAARLSWDERAWPNSGRALFIAGVVTAVLGAALATLPVMLGFAPGSVSAAASVVWGVGLVVLLAGVFVRGAVVRYAAPAFRWERDSRGGFVRVPLDQAPDEQTTGRAWWIALGAILAAGAALRFGLMRALPDTCVAWECAVVLGGGAGATPMVATLLAVGGAFTQDSLAALRLSTALLSSLTLPVFVLLLRRFASSGGILLGATLLAFHPWHLQITSTSGVAVEGALLVALALWGSVAGLQSGRIGGWAVAGLSIGLLIGAAPALLWAWAAWLILLVVLSLAHPENRRRPAGLWVAAGATVAGALAPWMVGASNLPAPGDLPAVFGEAGALLGVQMGALVAAARVAAPLWLATLTIAGIGAPARLGRGGLLVLLTAASAALVVLVTPASGTTTAPPGSVLGLWGVTFAALALDQVLRAAQRAWRPLVRPRALAAWATALLVVLGLVGAWRVAREPSSSLTSLADVDALALADFMTGLAADGGDDGPLLLVPANLLDHPSVRLAGGSLMAAGRLLPFAWTEDLPWSGAAPAGVVYVLPVDAPALLEAVKTVYPHGVGATIRDAEGRDRLRTWRVDPATLFESAGLEQYVYAGADFGSADEALFSSSVGPLQFPWGESPPMALPFSVEWQGSLVVRESGAYTFSVAAPVDAEFSMTLDDRLVLDSSAGLLARSETLPTGTHRIKMFYRGGETPGDLALLWETPWGEAAPIPREALFNPPLPVQGLVGAYMASDDWSGPAFTLRQDSVIEADASLPRPWSVVWQGRLAAPRAGEYLIGAVSSGPAWIDVGGRRVATREVRDEEALGSPAEGLIYLERGWHPIEIRFSSGETVGDSVGDAADDVTIEPQIRLYWQPPGSSPAPLPAAVLSPSPVELGPADRPLPEIALVDERLGDAEFALSADPSLWQPQVRLAPEQLSALPFTRVWSAGSCGEGEAYLNSPHGLAVDPARGVLYVADMGNRRIGALSTSDGAPKVLPIEGLEEPVDVAMGADGRLIVLDTVAPRLVFWDPESGIQEEIVLGEAFYRPRGIAVDALGLIYVADTGGARVAVVQPDGAVTAVFGGVDSALGRGQPADVIAEGGAIWAIAAEEGRLWRLDTLGSFTAIQPTDTINGPHLASSGERLFLSDPARQQVIALDARGMPLGALADVGAFALPTGVTAWQEGEATLLAVADTAACAVTLWRAEGW